MRAATSRGRLIVLQTIEQRIASAAGPTSGFDYLRICLAVSVLSWHCLPLTAGAEAAGHFMAGPLGPVVRILLPAFFALSGFLVAASLERNTLGAFLIFRGLRIVPALAVEIMLSALILGPILTIVPLSSYFSDSRFIKYFLNVFGLIHYQLPGVFGNVPYPNVVNGSLWTVPYELECYLMLAVFAMLGIMKRARALFLIVLIGGVLLLTISYLRETPDLKLDNAVPGRSLVLCFLAGTMFYVARAFVPYSKVLCAACLLVTMSFLSVPALYVFSPIPASYATVWIGLQNFKRLPILFSGDYSYGVYLYAFPMQQTWATILGARAGFWNVLILSLASVFFFAAFSWHVIERPSLSLKRIFRSRARGQEKASEMKRLWDKTMGRSAPFNALDWHEWTTGLWPVKSVDGGRVFGPVWRRLHKGVWQYRRRNKPGQDVDARQW